MTSLSPIFVAHLFRDVSQQLVKLLRSLNQAEWHLPTLSSERQVKDIASHLLDGSLRRLSMQRDGYRPQNGASQPCANEPLLDFLNWLNAEWETATRRLSPEVVSPQLLFQQLVAVDKPHSTLYLCFGRESLTPLTHRLETKDCSSKCL